MNFNFGTQNDPILNLEKDQILDLSKHAPCAPEGSPGRWL